MRVLGILESLRFQTIPQCPDCQRGREKRRSARYAIWLPISPPQCPESQRGLERRRWARYVGMLAFW